MSMREHDRLTDPSPGGPSVAEGAAEPRHASPAGAAARDCAFLAVTVLLSVLPYIGRLGFYSDDWAFLGQMATSTDRSLPGLFDALYTSNMRMRPAQALYQAVLYAVFGLQPLGYHVVNTLVFTTAVVLLYLSLRQAGVRRAVAVSVPLVFSFLPHYSTDRFWYAAFQANLSLLLCFLGVYADLRSLHARRPAAAWALRALGLACLAVAGLAYEVVLPLFVVKLGVIWWRQRRQGTAGPLPDLLALVALAAFKLSVNVRPEAAMGWYQRAFYVKWVAKQALAQNFGRFGRGLPGMAWQAARHYAGAQTLILGAAISTCAALYLRRVLWEDEPGPQGTARSGLVKGRHALLAAAAEPLALLGAGLALFGAGYAVFGGTTQIQFSPLGVANRTALAGAIGVAFVFVALALVPSRLPRLPGGAGRGLSALLLGSVCFCGFVVTATLGGFWGEAGGRARRALSQIERDVPALPPGSTLLLDGVCPYVGPAVVFESSWDLAGALQVSRRDATLRASIVHPGTRAEPEGVTTLSYNDRTTHPYPNVYVYDVGRRSLVRLGDYAAARRYFTTQSHNCGGACPAGAGGAGVEVF